MNEEIIITEYNEVIDISNTTKDAVIKVMNNSNYAELDKHTEDDKVNDRDNNDKSYINIEVVFLHEIASMHYGYLKKINERVQKEVSSEFNALDEKFAISYLKKSMVVWFEGYLLMQET